MRRDGPTAAEIVKWCKDANWPTPVDDRKLGRKLERWRQDRMLPSDGTPSERYTAHLLQLLGLEGKSRDNAALIMATRGFGCDDRLRKALLTLHGDAQILPVVDMNDDEVLDDLCSTVQGYMTPTLDTVPRGLGRPYRRLLRERVDDVVEHRSETTIDDFLDLDPREHRRRRRETPEILLHSFGTNLAQAAVTEDVSEAFYDEDLVADFLGLTASEVAAGALRVAARAARYGPAMARWYVENVPVDVLAKLARFSFVLGLGLDEVTAARMGPTLMALAALCMDVKGHPLPAAVATVLSGQPITGEKLHELATSEQARQAAEALFDGGDVPPLLTNGP